MQYVVQLERNKNEENSREVQEESFNLSRKYKLFFLYKCIGKLQTLYNLDAKGRNTTCIILSVICKCKFIFILIITSKF